MPNPRYRKIYAATLYYCRALVFLVVSVERSRDPLCVELPVRRYSIRDVLQVCRDPANHFRPFEQEPSDSLRQVSYAHANGLQHVASKGRGRDERS